MKQTHPINQADLVELGFMDARAKLLDIAAFLDRMERHRSSRMIIACRICTGDAGRATKSGCQNAPRISCLA